VEMTNFLFVAAGFVLVMAALGLLRVLRGPGNADRILSVQLIGSAGGAILLLLAAATKTPSIVDVALMLALLAAFTSVGFLRDASGSPNDRSNATDSE
jgi:multicomponent Na+:H+ antiporter subunit F